MAKAKAAKQRTLQDFPEYVEAAEHLEKLQAQYQAAVEREKILRNEITPYFPDEGEEYPRDPQKLKQALDGKPFNEAYAEAIRATTIARKAIEPQQAKLDKIATACGRQIFEDFKPTYLEHGQNVVNKLSDLLQAIAEAEQFKRAATQDGTPSGKIPSFTLDGRFQVLAKDFFRRMEVSHGITPPFRGV